MSTCTASRVATGGSMPHTHQRGGRLHRGQRTAPASTTLRPIGLGPLVRGAPAAVEPLTARYIIDHPYGQLIGWSVIMPRKDTVYESRWTTE